MIFPFSQLILTLDHTTMPSEKLLALSRFFYQKDSPELLWGLYLFIGRKLKSPVKSAFLKELVTTTVGIPPWLFEESLTTSGNLAETLTLLLPVSESPVPLPLNLMVKEISNLGKMEKNNQASALIGLWKQLSNQDRYVFNQLLIGKFHPGVSPQLVFQSLASVYNLNPVDVVWRLSAKWTPGKTTFSDLLLSPLNTERYKPYPFCFPVERTNLPESAGLIENWIVDWNKSGVRCQLIYRSGEFFIWSSDGDLLMDRFPEFQSSLHSQIPDFVLDGIIHTETVGKITKEKGITDSTMVFTANDLLEYNGTDLRTNPLSTRYLQLTEFVQHLNDPRFMVSGILEPRTWEELTSIRNNARTAGADGIRIRHRESAYETENQSGRCWIWKSDPMTIQAVLLYAQPGEDQRNSGFHQYTVGVWDGNRLITIAKTNTGLTETENAEVDQFVRMNTLERFGPVRTVKPSLVFEVAFDDIRPSSRHKSGVTLQAPRINRWLRNHPPEDADTLESVTKLIR